ncbi:family 20 glycosylhydrolase [Asticcacaulis sp. MM231]|uniref:family 20 glycosylhydrolase n=1 Tax=Asticcacaulis sp. MM231 TaxID=3157666 RepID=UPI0032D5B150
MAPRNVCRLQNALTALLLFAALIMAPLDVAAATSQPSLALRWRVVTTSPASTRAAFILTNTGKVPITASGWAIYFTSIAGAKTAEKTDSGAITHVVGSLYSIRPSLHESQSVGMIAPGASLRLYLDHPEIMVMSDKAPTAPYIVFDAHPADGLAILDYQREPIEPTTQMSATGGSVITPEAIYAQNDAITDVPLSALPPVFPTPLHVDRTSGSVLLKAKPQILAPHLLAQAAAFARTLFAGYDLPHDKGEVVVRLELGTVPDQTSPEAYRLTISPHSGIVVTGNAPVGVYFGLQSLRQLLAGAERVPGGFRVPAVTVVDAPRFPYRGLMMDVARNFQSKEKVFDVIDLMARYKLNSLHLHLTDDEGWRLAIPRLPELTTVGARRGHSVDGSDRLPPAYGSGPDISDGHGSGFYTADDYVAILAYAKARHIDVIPEIEMPGHARAAVRAMQVRARRLSASGDPHAADFLLSDPSDLSVYESAQAYSDNVLDPGLESTYRFIAIVVAEVAALHRRAGVPLRVLHVGGDELADGAWEGSPAAQKAMSQLPGHTTADVWNHFYDRVDTILESEHIEPAGWEELGVRKERIGGQSRLTTSDHFLHRNVTLYVWNNLAGSQDLAYRLANTGYQVILAPATNLYFDMAYSYDPAEPGHNWAAYTDLKDVYTFDPMAMTNIGSEPQTSLSAAGRANITGLEATLFSETIREPQRIDYMLMPRLLALAERAWAPEPAWARAADPVTADALRAADWSSFANSVGKQILPGLDADMPNLAYRLPPPGLRRDGARILVNTQLPGLTLRYTTDGRLPDTTSPHVTGPITEKGLITVAAFSHTGRSGRASSLTNP